jgi:hypothetical protein
MMVSKASEPQISVRMHRGRRRAGTQAAKVEGSAVYRGAGIAGARTSPPGTRRERRQRDRPVSR